MRAETKRGWTVAAAAAAVLLVAGCQSGEGSGDRATGDSSSTTTAAANGAAAGGGTAGAAPRVEQKCADNNDGLTLPTGFCATVFAEGLGAPRHIASAPNGDLFVNVAGAKSGSKAGIVVLRDRDGDGDADSTTVIGNATGTGVAYRDGMLYADAGPTIVRWRVPAGTMTATGAAETVVSGLPSGGHSARTMVLGAGDALYVNVGSATNSCQVKDRANNSPGEDPCKELATRAGLWKYSAAGTNQAHAASARFATGIRNGMGLAIHPTSGTVYATQHGRDQLTQNWGRSAEYGAENPAEVLLSVSQNDDFGWPYCYYSLETKATVLAPEYGGDGTKPGRCASAKAPVAQYPGHWAPMSLLFYTGSQMPARYRNGVFIAFHGSWNRAPQPQAGYQVVFQPLDASGKASGAYEAFANGFAGSDMSPQGATHRPVGLAQSADGGIYVSDDKGGRIYKIVYTGAK
jgi:glucose/arabinose dehydrogenase